MTPTGAERTFGVEEMILSKTERDGRIVGYHSSRRSPHRAAVEAIIPVYAQLRDIERGVTGAAAAAQAGKAAFVSVLENRGQSYEEFVWELIGLGRAA